MARRIALSVIVLITVLLSVVVVPLGLRTAAEETSDFTGQSVAVAETVANVAEEHLDDHEPAAPLRRAVAELERHGDQVTVYNAGGNWVAGRHSAIGATSHQIDQALAGRSSTGHPSDDRLLVLSPVLRDETNVSIGVVALSRSTKPLDRSIATLWAWIALISLAGVAAASTTAVALARWVSRPLGSLEGVAQRLGTGEFDARAPAEKGPREVRRLAENFNMMAARLESLLRSHQVMIADVSHQLRTPLAALRLRLDVLALGAPSQLADELAGAQDEIARLSRMVDGLLAVARAENVTGAAVIVAVDTVIAERAAAWSPAADDKRIALAVTSTGPLRARLGDGDLEQVLDNLLANAIEAVPAGGAVRMSSESAEGVVRVIVADNGPGMTVQERRAALHRYATATPGGTGLGLAIVHRLVTSGGGTLTLSDTLGGGLTVVADLPAAGARGPSRAPERRP